MNALPHAWLLVLALAPRTDLPHRPKDELGPDFGTEVPFGLAGSIDADARATAELGRSLFFDARLSLDGQVSCASCHVPEHGFADPRALSVGVLGRTTLRNSPSLFNRGLGTSFFWDGRVATLEEQVLLPIQDENEMGMTLDAVLQRVREDAELARRFGGEVTRERLGAALAGFVRTVWLGDSPVDRFQAGDFAALGVEERLGLWIYESKGGCWRCHSGANFTDEGFHNTGIGVIDGAAEEGRAKFTGKPEDRGRFKTPSLRGVALTAPYMHDGSKRTLEEVVEFYRAGGGANAGLDPKVEKLELDDADARHVVAFLKALSTRATGPRPEPRTR